MIPTRKRRFQACLMCNKKRIKCDGASPRCSTCQAMDVVCSYGIPKKRGTKTGSRLATPQQMVEGSWADKTTPEDKNPQSAASPARSIRTTGPPNFPSRLSPEISKRLFHTYFDCIHPMWPLLYKPLYTSLDYTYPSPRIPTPLVLAIFAIASCVDNTQSAANILSPTQERVDCPEPRAFFEEALSLLHQENDNGHHLMGLFAPSITSCQVLVILALQQHGVAEYYTASILSGFAITMAIELRLHRADESNEPVEKEIRSRLWWNLYILEKMMAGEMGRPLLLRSEETDTPWPSTSESDEFELMPQQLPGGQTQRTSIKMRTISCFHTTISMSIILERVYREIYGIAARKSIRDDQNAGERLRTQLWLELQNWEKDVDASPLRLDLSEQLTSVPPSITNHVIISTGTILLHRPFIARWPPDLTFVDPVANPYDICLAAANRICIILEKYLERLPGGPSDMVFSIFIAASIFLHHSKQVAADAAVGTQLRLKQCIHWLSVLGKSWKTAGTRHQQLKELYDLSQALRAPQPTESLPVPHLDSQQDGSLANLLNQNTQLSTSSQPALHAVSQSYVEDWSFLRDFGDSTDQFYSWDVELRDLLDGGFPLDEQLYP